MKPLFMDANQGDAVGKRFAGSLVSFRTQLSGAKNDKGGAQHVNSPAQHLKKEMTKIL